MKIFIGVTDRDWFEMLSNSDCEEVNFWKPGGHAGFQALDVGELFLFKLHRPYDYIVGGGFFLKFSRLPASLAWDAFGESNGARSLDELNRRIRKYRNVDPRREPNPEIGCIILSMPFFFSEDQWIPAPADWKPNIVQGKTYDTSESIGSNLYRQVMERLKDCEVMKVLSTDETEAPRYGKEQIIRPRIGQGAFKVLITDAYSRRCAITGEKTLPVLEAAHIKPYSLNGPHTIDNGLLLRSDYHHLFDMGYLTITPEYIVEISRRIKEDFGNGREYYSRHGSRLQVVPRQTEEQPARAYLEWHNNSIYVG